MSEHKTNKTAVVRAMLPPFPTGSDFTHVELRGGFNLRRGILIVPPEKIRMKQDGSKQGTLEVLLDSATGESWSAPPDDFEVIAEGTQLGYEHLDYVVHVMGSKVDRTLVVGRDGGHPMTMAPLTELCRVPAVHFLRMFGLGEKPGVNGAPSGLIVGG
jgi:hypothetical protein